jgi:glycyl-tRNA synthetase
MVDCRETKLRYRADQLFYSAVTVNGGTEPVGYVCVQEGTDEDMMQEGLRQAKALLKAQERPKSDRVDPLHFLEFMTADPATMAQIPSPSSGKPTLTPPRDFNLMFQTNVGAVATSSSSHDDDDDETQSNAVAYLRPETAQGIFINYKNILSTCRLKIPFGIAQIGKAFRNEITPRNFIFRSREFEQMEVEYFIPPGADVWPQHHEQWIAASYDFLTREVGLRPELLHYKVHDQLAHYATACTDITFDFPFGEQSELMGIAARGNYDLTQHGTVSGKNMDYYDEETKEKYIPHVIEPSLGVDRLILALICSAYRKDLVGGEERSWLQFHPRVAPVQVAVLPLLKNKPALVAAARTLYETLLQRNFAVQYDATGAIGRRYRRADEIGIPFCITVDFETVEGGADQSVTIRDRDTTRQVRLPLNDVVPYLSRAIHGYE